MAPEQKGRSKKMRASLLAVALLSLFGFAIVVGYAPHWGIPTLVLELLSLAACVLYIVMYVRVDSPTEFSAGSLMRIILGYAFFLVIWLVAGTVLFAIEYEVAGFMDYVAIVGYGIISIGLWGGIAYVILVLPIWYIGRRVAARCEKDLC